MRTLGRPPTTASANISDDVPFFPYVHLIVYPLAQPSAIEALLKPIKRALDWKWSSARYYLLDLPRHYPGPPAIDSLPSEWLDETD